MWSSTRQGRKLRRPACLLLRCNLRLHKSYLLFKYYLVALPLILRLSLTLFFLTCFPSKLKHTIFLAKDARLGHIPQCSVAGRGDDLCAKQVGLINYFHNASERWFLCVWYGAHQSQGGQSSSPTENSNISLRMGLDSRAPPWHSWSGIEFISTSCSLITE